MPKQKRFNNAISNCRWTNNRGNNETECIALTTHTFVVTTVMYSERVPPHNTTTAKLHMVILKKLRNLVVFKGT